MSNIRKQLLAYLAGVLFCASATVGLYHSVRQERVLFRHAENSFSRGDFTGATRLYRESIQKGFKDAIAYIRLAQAYETMGSFNDAAAWYATLVENFPGSRKARIVLARALMNAGRIDEAVLQYKIALGETP